MSAPAPAGLATTATAETVTQPKQTRGGDVRNAPHPPVPAVNHLANRAPSGLGLMWAAHVQELQEKLHRAGIERTDTQVDNAIQGARESLHDEDGVWPNIDTGYGWWLVLPRVADYLDVDYDLIVEVAS